VPVGGAGSRTGTGDPVGVSAPGPGG
jgi:hypothetical protein